MHGPADSTHHSRRRFLHTTAVAGGALALGAHARLAGEPGPYATSLSQAPLPYAYDALEPAIDAATLRLHYEQHHAAYVRTLRTALADHPALLQASAERLVSALATLPPGLRETVRNHAGGHLNHSLFWSLLTAPAHSRFARRSPLGRAIRAQWNGEEGFRTAFRDLCLAVFGSGWGWLCTRADGSLFLASTANQDNPLMPEAGAEVGFPVLGIDLWEHAYYLRYENERGRYLDAILGAIDWDEANRRFEIRSFT